MLLLTMDAHASSEAPAAPRAAADDARAHHDAADEACGGGSSGAAEAPFLTSPQLHVLPRAASGVLAGEAAAAKDAAAAEAADEETLRIAVAAAAAPAYPPHELSAPSAHMTDGIDADARAASSPLQAREEADAEAHHTTTGEFNAAAAAAAASPPSGAPHVPAPAPAPLMHHDDGAPPPDAPASLLGRRVVRVVSGKPYDGVVVSVRVTRTHGILWRVYYAEDGDAEELTWRELRDVLQPAEPAAASAGGVRPELPPSPSPPPMLDALGPSYVRPPTAPTAPTRHGQ
jgi:hypothetical protein